MPVIAVSRWQISHDDAQRILRDAAPNLKTHGAQSVSLGRITTGQYAGQITVVVAYENFETFGRAMHAAQNDQQYQARYAEALKAGQLMARNVVMLEEITTS